MNKLDVIKIIQDNNENLIYKLIDENILIKNDIKYKIIYYISIYAKNNEIIK